MIDRERFESMEKQLAHTGLKFLQKKKQNNILQTNHWSAGAAFEGGKWGDRPRPRS